MVGAMGCAGRLLVALAVISSRGAGMSLGQDPRAVAGQLTGMGQQVASEVAVMQNEVEALKAELARKNAQLAATKAETTALVQSAATMGVDRQAAALMERQAALGTSNMLALNTAVDMKADIFLAVIYVSTFLTVIRGMFAKLWCDSFFMSDRASYTGGAVDASFVQPRWHLESLDSIFGKEGSKSKYYDGTWVPPVNPFDTNKAHHLPASLYVQLYCQEMRYSLGWVIAAAVGKMFQVKKK